MTTTWPVIVLGGSGYVAGEMLRLIAGHPNLTLGAAVSTGSAGEPIAAAFAHLRSAFPNEHFASVGDAVAALAREPHWVLLSAAPHGASAGLVGQFVDAATAQGTRLTIVDASADFRFGDAASYETVYGQPHAAPGLLEHFTCAVPEQLASISTPHASHPGCFASAMLLGIVPLLAADACEPDVYVSAVTGSTGAGRTPRETTHHPVRQSNLFAYGVLKHRHSPEVEVLCKAASGCDLKLHFVPHSGPFARGIHATIFARMKRPMSRLDVLDVLRAYYRDADLVAVDESPPRMKDVAGSSRATLGADVDAGTIVVCSVLDNLLKGAASGSVQWVNRLLGLADATGLLLPAAGWL